MNKRKLQEFASWAKLNLEKQIEISLRKIGISSENDIKRSKVQGDITVIDGIESTFNKSFQTQREEIIHKIKSDGFDHSIEQFASTWFNRIIALRFMEVHDYFDHGFKLFPSEPNTIPEILTKLSLVSEELNLDMTYCHQLQDSGHQESLYRYVLFQQSNALANPLPMLFSAGLNYLEYFIPTPLLFGDTLINRLIEIDEDDFNEDVEIIGWLYQFYIANKKDEVFASKKSITKDTLPAVTQLFTPTWIVKYMAENSLGRLWLESYPNSQLKSTMKYYVEEAEQSESVLKQLEDIKYKDVNVEDIKIIEPCSGSGHILTYLFDLLFQMYLEKGYTKKEIPGLIIKNNLFGLDVDQRATQLASFALAMKARSIDNNFFDLDRYVRPKVYEILDSKPILYSSYNGKSYLDLLKDYNNTQWKDENHLLDEEIKVINYIVELFEDAKVIGSLLKVKPNDYLALRDKLEKNYRKNTQADIFTSGFFDFEFKVLLEILRTAYILNTKYDVMITNPPYQGVSGLEENVKSYIKINYLNTSTDLFAAFMETNFVKHKGYLAMINQHQWMFTKSYKEYRNELIESKTIVNLVHLGTRAFEEITGEKVQSVAFVKRKVLIDYYLASYFKLKNLKSPEAKKNAFENNKEKYRYYKSLSRYMNIPWNPLAYWISQKTEYAFNHKTISEIGYIGRGLETSNQDKYERLWFEVDFTKISLSSRIGSLENKKWFLFSSGGGYRRWYGNQMDVVLWENDGYQMRNDKGVNGKKIPLLKNHDKYFKKCVTWSSVGTGYFGARMINDSIFGNGSALFIEDENMYIPLMGLLNSKIVYSFLEFLSPSLTFNAGDLGRIPVSKDIFSNYEIVMLVNECIEYSKTDWNSQETSIGFTLKITNNSLSRINEDYENVVKNQQSMIESIFANETKLNYILLELYGLSDEIKSDIDSKEISLKKYDKTNYIKDFISYLIGVLMGRYSLAEEGLIFAGGDFDVSRYGNYDVDQDGIIPIFPDLSFENGLVHRIIKLIKRVYGEEHYRENIDFIASALGKKSNETSEETLNRYLNQEFYNDHVKAYQKRPIYWMFSSGNKNGFKALIYMHRYNSNTLAKMNASYFQPATTVLRTRINEIEKQSVNAQEKDKIQLERLRFSLAEQLNEAIEYGQVLDYMANKYTSIDLDDGVKVNYAKFQGIEISTSNGKVKKDLLITVK